MLGGPGRPHCRGDILRRDRNDKLISPRCTGEAWPELYRNGVLQRKVEPQLGVGRIL